MILTVLVLLTLSNTDYITAAAETLKMTPRSLETVTVLNRINPAPEEISSWIESRSKRNSLKLDELGGATNAKADLSNRKSKILRSLAFIAGLSVGSLAGAASSDVKTYAKFPPLALNIGASRISPQIAAVYDMTNPYIFATPLTFYSLWNPLRLQAINGIQQLPQNQILNLLDSNKSTTDISNNEDEYVDEAKKVENVKTVSNTNENNKKNTEFQVEYDRNAEEKVLSTDTACTIRNEGKPKQGTTGKSVSKDHENSDDSLTTAALRATNPAANITNQNVTQINSTVSKNGTNTTETAPYSYYGGYPQNINHIDLTTDAYQHKYHEYEHINYNLPSYDRPVNFYSNDRYNYYPVAPVDSYPSDQFHQEQNPEYFSNDFKRFVYPSDNTPPFVGNDFRPVV